MTTSWEQPQDLADYLIANKQLHSLLRKYQFVKGLLYVYEKLCQVDLSGRRQNDHNLLISSKTKGIIASKATKAAGAIYWPKMIMFFALLCASHLTIGFVLQYAYDYNLVKLEKLDALFSSLRTAANITTLLQNEGGFRSMSTEEDLISRILELQATISKLREALSIVGAPFISSRFFAEPAYLYMGALSCGLYFYLIFYNHFVKQIDFSSLRSFLDLKGQMKLCDKQSAQWIDRFLVSSRNFTNILISKCSGGLLARSRGRQRGNSNYSPELITKIINPLISHSNEQAREYLNLHSRTRLQLRAMLSRGLLRPANKSLAWVAGLCSLYFYFSLACILYTLFLTLPTLLFALYTFIKWQNFDGIHIGDLLILIDMACLMTVAIVSGNFYVIFLLTHSYDQTQLSSAIGKLIKECILVNKRHHHYIKSMKQQQSTPPGGAGGLISDAGHERQRMQERLLIEARMNWNMLFTYMHYKLCAIQFGTTISEVISILSSIAVVLVAFLPIIGRICVPYVDPEVLEHFKRILVQLSVITLAAGDINLISACHLHSRMLRLYKHMSSLLAHTEELIASERDEDQRDNTGTRYAQKNIYDQHLVWAIRKELEEPERFLAQFACKFSGTSMVFNYQNLLRIHFWIGFVLISVMFSTNTNNQVGLDRVLSDPLGIL